MSDIDELRESTPGRRPSFRGRIPARVAVLVAGLAVGIGGAGVALVDGTEAGPRPGAASDRGVDRSGPSPSPPGSPTSRPVVTSAPATLPEVGTHSARLDDLHSRTAPAPTRIRVGDIEVSSPVAPAGVTTDGSGELEVPTRADAVVWYRFGPSPGTAGSAVLAGHVDYDGARGSFFRLAELEPGALISITYDDGSERRFRVTNRRRIAKAALPTDEIFSRKGSPRLTLITCGGDFDRSARSYRDNVVVQAVPVG